MTAAVHSLRHRALSCQRKQGVAAAFRSHKLSPLLLQPHPVSACSHPQQDALHGWERRPCCPQPRLLAACRTLHVQICLAWAGKRKTSRQEREPPQAQALLRCASKLFPQEQLKRLNPWTQQLKNSAECPGGNQPLRTYRPDWRSG